MCKYSLIVYCRLEFIYDEIFLRFFCKRLKSQKCDRKKFQWLYSDYSCDEFSQKFFNHKNFPIQVSCHFCKYFRAQNNSSLQYYVCVFLYILGDFSILVRSGMSMCKAALLNLLSGCTSIIGVFIGVALGSNEEIRKWLVAVTGGMFIYISLVAMVGVESSPVCLSVCPSTWCQPWWSDMSQCWSAGEPSVWLIVFLEQTYLHSIGQYLTYRITMMMARITWEIILWGTIPAIALVLLSTHSWLVQHVLGCCC